MAVSVPDDSILAVIVLFCLYFSLLALYFPVFEAGRRRSAPGLVWAHLRAMIFPFFASISWFIFAAYMVAAGNSATDLLMYFGYMMFIVYAVVGFVMVFYLALRPIAGALEGEESLES